MENEQLQQTESQTMLEQKSPYEPPTATFVSLKSEERLTECLLEKGCSSPG